MHKVRSPERGLELRTFYIRRAHPLRIVAITDESARYLGKALFTRDVIICNLPLSFRESVEMAGELERLAPELYNILYKSRG